MMKIDLLAFAAHPDDVELSASGTLLLHKAQGKTTGIIDLTRGELGSRGNMDLRSEEAQNASAILGIDVRENLGMADGFFEINEASLLKVIEVIRKYRPEIVLAPALSDRHPDHSRAAELVSRACFLSGLVKIESQFGGGAQSAWRPKAVYHYIQDRIEDYDLVIDITPYWEKKMESILAYSSQFHTGKDSSGEPQTPISSKEFMEYLKAKAIAFGRPIQVMYAEAFKVERTPGVHSLFDLY